MRVTADDPRLSWEGAVSLQRDGAGVQPWRIPFEEQDLFPQPLVERAEMPAGVRLTFATDATAISGACAAVAEAAPIELVCDGHLIGAAPWPGRSRSASRDCPPD